VVVVVVVVVVVIISISIHILHEALTGRALGARWPWFWTGHVVIWCENDDNNVNTYATY
jgi:hypothetical protein